jgi:tRNA(His) 5'-end guanylyltransferase
VAKPRLAQGTDSGQKNELLFSHGINYANLDPLFRKGSLFARIAVSSPDDAEANVKVGLLHTPLSLCILSR